MTIKVLHHLRNLGLGGTEKTCQLFAAYASSDFEVHVAYENDGPRGDLFRDMPNVKLWQVSRDDDSLQKLINRLGIDILHVYRSGFEEFPEPGVHVSVSHFVETNVFGFVDHNPHIDRSLFMSKWLMDYTLHGFTHPRFDFVNNPVESPKSPDKLFGLSSDITWLGRCGRPDNGIYNAINVEAAHLLRMQGYDVGFIVMAPPSNMIDDLNRHGIPYRSIKPTVDPIELSKFYNSIDIHAHARADGETFGVNIAEAMMHSKPVVTHIAIPSSPNMGVFQSQTELVDDGETGFIVQNNSAEYAEALKFFLDDPRIAKDFGNRGFLKAIEQYHVEGCVEKLERIYKEVMTPCKF